MNRWTMAVLSIAVASCHPLGPLTPRLCVSSLVMGADEMPCTIDGGQDDLVALTPGAPVLVQHVLPKGVDPQQNQVAVSVVSPGGEVQRMLSYGKGSDDAPLATAVFDFPDGGDCFVSVSANILNSQLTVTSHGTACP